MSPIDWAKRPLQKYAEFNGRAPRAEYWWYTLGIIVAAIVLNIVESLLGLSGMVGPYGPLSALCMLALLVPGVAVTVRRLHDTNRSGWWILVAVVPYAILGFMMARSAGSTDMSGLAAVSLFGIIALIGGLVLLVFMLLAGNPGDNRYGPDPYAGGSTSAATA